MRRLAPGVALSLLVACKLATVRPLPSSSAASTVSGSFDASAYVESVWRSRVLPTVERDATDCADLLLSLKGDPEGTARRLGRGPHGPAYFLVKGEGRVVSVDRRSRTGLMGLAVGRSGAEADVWLQIGPVIQGMAIRDAVGFIGFDQFVNQLDYADAGNALNQHVLDTVVKGLDAGGAKGSLVSFAGALTAGERVVITPVRLGRKQR
jgi:predicted lipoprotein